MRVLSNGQMLTAKALLDKTPNPTDAQIRDGMKGALCRHDRPPHQCRGEAGGAEDGMSTSPSRRAFLQTSGMLVAPVAAISVEGVEAF